MGPNTEPCGTPLLTGMELDFFPLSTTSCVLSLRKSFIQHLTIYPKRRQFLDQALVTLDIVLDKIMNMYDNKSPGPDYWPISIIKSMGEFIAIPLSIIFSKSFISGTLPHDWKNAQVTLIHKKGARNNVSNYRPVSLTSIFGKLMETIVKDHLISHLILNNLLSAYNLDLYLADRVLFNYFMYLIISLNT